jgi:hypothetical protein
VQLAFSRRHGLAHHQRRKELLGETRPFHIAPAGAGSGAQRRADCNSDGLPRGSLYRARAFAELTWLLTSVASCRSSAWGTTTIKERLGALSAAPVAACVYRPVGVSGDAQDDGSRVLASVAGAGCSELSLDAVFELVAQDLQFTRSPGWSSPGGKIRWMPGSTASRRRGSRCA